MFPPQDLHQRTPTVLLQQPQLLLHPIPMGELQVLCPTPYSPRCPCRTTSPTRPCPVDTTPTLATRPRLSSQDTPRPRPLGPTPDILSNSRPTISLSTVPRPRLGIQDILLSKDILHNNQEILLNNNSSHHNNQGIPKLQVILNSHSGGKLFEITI